MANKIFGADFTDDTNPAGTETVTVFNGSVHKDVTLANFIGASTKNATSKATPVDADKLPLWDSVASALKYLSWSNLKATLKTYFDTLYSPIALTTGWGLVTDTWTRTGNYTFTVSGDVTATYRKGTKVRYKDGGSYEYGVIGSSSYSAPNTTVTLITNASYAMAAATITDTYLSYASNPEGFPDFFTWTPSITNFTASTLTGKWKVAGKQIFYEFYSITPTISGVPVLTLPIAAASTGSVTRPVMGTATFLDSGTNAFPGWVLKQDSTSVTLRAMDASGTYAVLTNISSTVPFTWTTSDECNAQGNYEF